MFRRIESIEDTKDPVLVKMKDGKECAYLVEPSLNSTSQLDPLKGYDCCFLVCYNTKSNLDFMIKNWDAFVKFKRHFSIWFVNPFSRAEKKWAIYPATHDMVTEKASLKSGLKSLFSTVESTNDDEIKKIIKKS